MTKATFDAKGLMAFSKELKSKSDDVKKLADKLAGSRLENAKLDFEDTRKKAMRLLGQWLKKAKRDTAAMVEDASEDA